MAQQTKKKTAQTPKQLAIKADAIMRGLDNSSAVIDREKKKIDDKLKELRPVLTGLSNVIEAQKTQAQKTQAQKTQAGAPAKAPAKKAPPAKPAKAPAKPAKAQAKAKGKTDKGKTDKKPPVEGRPILKDAIKEMLAAAGGRAPATRLYHDATGKYGYWSRQGFYAALHDEKAFRKVDDNPHGDYELVPGSDDVEEFVEKSAKNQAVSQVS